MTTVSDIIDRIEQYINDNEFDPANGIGNAFRVWDGAYVPGEPDGAASRRRLGDVITIHAVWDFDANRLRLSDTDRADLLVRLRATAEFEWDQSREARAVLDASQ